MVMMASKTVDAPHDFHSNDAGSWGKKVTSSGRLLWKVRRLGSCTRSFSPKGREGSRRKEEEEEEDQTNYISGFLLFPREAKKKGH